MRELMQSYLLTGYPNHGCPFWTATPIYTRSQHQSSNPHAYMFSLEYNMDGLRYAEELIRFTDYAYGAGICTNRLFLSHPGTNNTPKLLHFAKCSKLSNERNEPELNCHEQIVITLHDN